MLESGAEHPQIGFEDDDQRFGAGALEEVLDVVAQPEAVDAEDGFLIGLSGVDQPPGLVDRLMPAVQVNASAVGSAEGERWRAGFAGLDGIRLAGGMIFKRRGKLRILRPQRREVRQQRRIGGEDESSGWIG